MKRASLLVAPPTRPRGQRFALHAALAIAIAVASACGGAQMPSDAKTTVVSLEKIDCAECGTKIVDELRRRPGVYRASFYKRSAEVHVVASPSFDVFTTVRRLAAEEGFEAILGAGRGRYLPGPTYPQGSDVQVVVKDGASVPDLAAVAVKGKVTVVDFSASWCEPCRKVDEHMVKVLGARSDVAYRKLDIGDWDTPLAQRYLKNVGKLPYVIVFGKNGVQVKEIKGLDLGQIDAGIAQGATL